MTTLRDVRPSLPPRTVTAAPARGERRPFRDNPRLILCGIILLIAALIAMITLADQSTQLSPDFLSDVILYALTAADLTILVVLLFVLARYFVKLAVERRRGLPFARFRFKLVLALLGLTIVPSVLILLVGSELIRNNTERWFSAPVDEVLASAQEIAREIYREHETAVAAHAARIAKQLPADAVAASDLDAVRGAMKSEITQGRLKLVGVYRLQPGQPPAPLVAVESPALSRGRPPASPDRLAARIAAGSTDITTFDSIDSGVDLVHAGALIRSSTGTPIGVVIASDLLPGHLVKQSRRITAAYESYTQLRVLKRPIENVYLSFFLMMTLMILFSATWTGWYLAKRITRPVQRLAEGAREIGAGRLDHRIEPETRDEFGSLVEAFNSMAGELAASQRKLERSRGDLERKNVELEERRRYIETVLERIATGVISIDADGRIETINNAALRLLEVDRAVVGGLADDVFGREDLRPLEALLRHLRAGAKDSTAQEIALARQGRELHLAAAVTPLLGEDGAFQGAVLVFDDVTPLIRTQRVAAWRDVARRLAHEIKNPLTPIQLCAERMRRHFNNAPPPSRELVDECTTTIVGEVESLKGLVDEFAQFARMPPPRTVPSNLNEIVTETLSLYNGLFREIEIAPRLADRLPPVRVDVEQIRRVIINLVDNAVEALGPAAPLRDSAAPVGEPVPAGAEPKRILVATQLDAGIGVARIVVADNGPGIPAADREKLFMPYYSTKKRGSGLGLAIVRRIIAEHGGSIDVADNVPTGTVFTIELPV